MRDGYHRRNCVIEIRCGIRNEFRTNKSKQEETRELARPERFELPTNWFEASYSIQLSYGRVELSIAKISPPVTVRLRYLLLLDSRRQTPYP